MESNKMTNETNLIKKYLLEHPEINSGDPNIISSLINTQANKDAEALIGKLSEKDDTNVAMVELEDDIDMTKVEKRSDLEKIIAASISIAKERNQLPEAIKANINTPEEIASNAFDSTTIIETVQKTANGDFSSITQMKDYLVDMATVKAVAIADALVSQGMEYLKALARSIALTYGGEGLANFVDYVMEYVAPIIEVNVKVAVANVLRKCAVKIKKIGNTILSRISEKKKNVNENLNS